MTYQKGLIRTTVKSSRRKSSSRRTSFLPGEHTDSEHFGENQVSSFLSPNEPGWSPAAGYTDRVHLALPQSFKHADFSSKVKIVKILHKERLKLIAIRSAKNSL